MLATIKSGEAAARRDLRMRLVCERLTGQPEEPGYVSAEMQRGIDCESLAFAAYELHVGQVAMPVGFVRSREHQAGCSPDGVIGDFDGLLSIKCPKTATHVRYLRGDKKIPSDYVPQMLHELWVTGAEFYDFLSWDDRLPEHLQVFYVRVQRDEAQIAEYAKKAIAFLDEVQLEEDGLRGLSALRAAV
jgi:hypothetical protein